LRGPEPILVRCSISEETRERVQQAARELGYRPHPGAQAMRGQSTHLLGLIVREVSDPWFAQIVELISDVAREKEYDLVLGSARSDPDEALALREMMLDLRYCDGLLLCGDLRESPEDHTFLAGMGQDRRLVSISRGSSAYVRPALTTVHQPMERIAAKAMELLLQMIDGQLVLDPVPQFLMEPELIVRDSCGPPPSGP
jgi:DNA-binding LacI/PurR family transcriptional regulator